jgi:rod shape-determining protein MreD
MFEQKSVLNLLMPYLIAILLVIANVSNIRIAGLTNVIPPFDLMAVFYFAAFKNVFVIWFVFLLGIWNDSLNGNPLGATSLCYILLVKFFSLVNGKMLIKENFIQVWQQFIIFCFLFLLLKWLILSVFDGTLHSLLNPFLQLILSSLFYVLMHKFFDYISNKFGDSN